MYILLTYDRAGFIFYMSFIVLSAVDVGGIKGRSTCSDKVSDESDFI